PTAISTLSLHDALPIFRLRWAFDFRSGETIDAELHHWRENDMSTTFDLLRHVRPGDLLLRDMGYFCLEALHEIHAAGAWFITRIDRKSTRLNSSHVKIS